LVVEGYGMGSLLRALARTLALSLLPWAAFIVVLLIDGCHDAWAGLAVLYVPYVAVPLGAVIGVARGLAGGHRG
jgi:hypothetical protein